LSGLVQNRRNIKTGLKFKILIDPQKLKAKTESKSQELKPHLKE